MLFSEDVKAAWGLATAVHSPGSGTLWRSLQRRHVVTTSVDIVKLVPLLIILIAPGGSLILPVIMRMFPVVLPSSFRRLHQVRDEGAYVGTFPELLAAAGETASRLPMDLASDFMQLLNDKEALHSLNWYLRALSTREVKAHAEGLATSTRFCKTKLELITSALSLCTNHALEAQLPDALVRRHAARLGLVVRGAEDAAGDTGALRVQLQEHWASVRVQDALLHSADGARTLSDDDVLAALAARGLRPAAEAVSTGAAPAPVPVPEVWREALRAWLQLSHADGVTVGLLTCCDFLTEYVPVSAAGSSTTPSA